MNTGWLNNVLRRDGGRGQFDPVDADVVLQQDERLHRPEAQVMSQVPYTGAPAGGQIKIRPDSVNGYEPATLGDERVSR